MTMHTYAVPHFLTIDQFQPREFQELLSLSQQMRWLSKKTQPLAGQTVVLFFEKPSLRTRVTFEVAVRRLGGWPVLLGREDERLGNRESIPDMARNLSLWVDGIVARVFSHAALNELATFSSVPVVNALSDYEHPCQALADLITLADVWEGFGDRTVVFVGDWNNVSRSLWKACGLAGLNFRAVCPAQYGPAAGEQVNWSSDPKDVAGADAIYTDTWASMGQEQELEARRRVFEPYQVNEQLLSQTGKPTLFMHCLPAHRGLEVTDAVIDSERSLVFQQAANRLPAEMAVLISLLERSNEGTHQEGRAGVLRRPGYFDHHSVAQRKLRV
jgi:ornithine carbamoyltransferase